MEEKDKNFKNSSFKEKIGMAKNYAGSLMSRGLNNKKADKKTKQLRVLSCLGDDGELIPCEYLRDSKEKPGEKYCGGCGCGDRKATWLSAVSEDYGKLDYPKVVCPLNMPGFANYEQSEPDESEEPITRRYYIEQMNEDRIDSIVVNSPEPPEIKKKDTKK